MLILKELSGPGKLNLHQGCSDWYPQIELRKDVRLLRKCMVNVNYTNKDNEYEQFFRKSMNCCPNLLEENTTIDPRNNIESRHTTRLINFTTL